MFSFLSFLPVLCVGSSFANPLSASQHFSFSPLRVRSTDDDGSSTARRTHIIVWLAEQHLTQVQLRGIWALPAPFDGTRLLLRRYSLPTRILISCPYLKIPKLAERRTQTKKVVAPKSGAKSAFGTILRVIRTLGRKDRSVLRRMHQQMVANLSTRSHHQKAESSHQPVWASRKILSHQKKCSRQKIRGQTRKNKMSCVQRTQLYQTKIQWNVGTLPTGLGLTATGLLEKQGFQCSALNIRRYGIVTQVRHARTHGNKQRPSAYPRKKKKKSFS